MATDAKFDRIQKILPHMSNNRDNGNAAAREALVQCELFLGNVSRHGHPTLCIGDQCTACNGVDELRGMVVRALSKPPRQCDVGTADEQERRFEKFCDSHKWVDDDGANACSSDCPLYKTVDCALHWAQMPYEAERKGEGDGRQSEAGM